MGKSSTSIRKKARNAPRFKGGKRAKLDKAPRRRPKLPGEAGYEDRLKDPESRVEVNYAHIKNKLKRRQMVGLLKQHQKDTKSANRRAKLAARERGEEVDDGWTRTIENSREFNETIVPDDDDEVLGDEAMDEFAPYFAGQTTPKIMMTTQFRPSRAFQIFLKEMKFVLPNCEYYKRMKYPLKKIIEYAKNHDFTDIIVFTEKLKKPHSMYIVHLPEGPTSMWRLTNLKLACDLKGGASLCIDHEPEVIMHNFGTRIGHRAARQLASIFPQRANFRGRRVIALHNMRDFVFFRHHRYQFKKEGTKAVLQEIGPRFTMKMRYMQHGTFDSKYGEYEWVWRPDSQVSRKQHAF